MNNGEEMPRVPATVGSLNAASAAMTGISFHSDDAMRLFGGASFATKSNISPQIFDFNFFFQCSPRTKNCAVTITTHQSIQSKKLLSELLFSKWDLCTRIGKEQPSA